MSGAPEFILSDVKTPEGDHVDVWVAAGAVEAIRPHDPQGVNAGVRDRRVINGGGGLISAPFVDAHFHLDATLSLGRPRLNRSGTLLEGIEIWAEQKPSLTEEDIAERARALITWAVARGTLAMRTHVDTCDPQLRAARA